MSSYLEHLPAIYRQDPFLGRFLLAFERILSGLPEEPSPVTGPSTSDARPELRVVTTGSGQGGLAVPPGIEAVLDRVHTYFTPGNPRSEPPGADGAPEEFLPWLASWVAVTLRDDWSSSRRRDFILRAAGLYRLRGTREGLEKLATLYVGHPVRVTEPTDAPAHYFQVKVAVEGSRPDLGRVQQEAQFVIDREKPAHTWYGLEVRSSQVMRIVNHPDERRPGLRVGHTTFLGVPPE